MKSRTASFESIDLKIKISSNKSSEDISKLSNRTFQHFMDDINSNSVTRRSLSQGSISYERLRSLKQMVDRAIKEHRVFSVAGPFPTIRQALKQRGWLEKMGTSAARTRSKRGSHAKLLEVEEGVEESPDPLLVARLLRNCTPDLLWALRSEAVDWRGLARWQLVNRFPKALFTTKVGLNCALQHMQWFTEEGVSETLFPRSYCVNQQDEMTGFVSDFRLTACFSVLRHVIGESPAISDTHEELENHVPAIAELPKKALWIPPKAVLFALSRAGEHMRHLRHEDVDDWSPAGGPSLSASGLHGPGGSGEGGRVWDCEWDQFLTYYYQLVHDGAQVSWESEQQTQEITHRATDAVSQYGHLRPYQAHDGILNLWIVKPGARSCGRGIHVMNRLETIIARTQPGLGKEARFVVQKYIERPMLIYKTKFDIRQWFLVTSAQPLTIWMYRESYLRFCSQIFDMTNLHESVHLSNNAVQCRYQNCRRDSGLPDENMWDCYTFQTYLRSIGRAEAWNEVIYPGMRAGIIGAMLASQDWLDSQRNCFELYGADFLLSEGDLRPWLLEVNCSPCMAPSTSVTARMCAQCLEDVLKVVVDRRDDREASTGMFDLVYKQNSPPAPPYQGVALGVKGRRLTASKPRRKKHRRSQQAECSCSSSCSSEVSTEDEGKVDLAAQTRVTLASPLKVIKAEINVPEKNNLRLSSTLNQQQQALPQSPNNPPPVSACELRSRLERLLSISARELTVTSTVNESQNVQQVESSNAIIITSPTPNNKSVLKCRKNRKSTNSGKFRGKISGKNFSVVQQENQNDKNVNKKNSKIDKHKTNKSKKVFQKKTKSISNKLEKSANCEEGIKDNLIEFNEADKNIDHKFSIDDIDANNNNKNNVANHVTVQSDVDSLLIQPDNMRSTKVNIISTCDTSMDNEEECFRDPGRSLALVKEWRRRLEATRASCEQMLAQLKAFRDPPNNKPPLGVIIPTPVVTYPKKEVAACKVTTAVETKMSKLQSNNAKKN